LLADFLSTSRAVPAPANKKTRPEGRVRNDKAGKLHEEVVRAEEDVD
jgi:hypothetical protein